jgi:methionyl-tRNA formyltransferase
MARSAGCGWPRLSAVMEVGSAAMVDGTLKVALLCPGAPRRCGVEDYTDGLTDALLAAGILVLRLGGSGQKLDAGRVLSTVGAEGCDLVHIQYPALGFGASLVPHLLPIRSPVPTALTLHEFSRTNRARRLSSILFSLGLHRLVFTTADEGLAFRRAFPWWQGQATVIPIGSNIPFLGHDPDPDPVILFFGHIKPNRGLEPFIAAATRAHAKGRPYRFRIIGSVPPGRDAYFAELRRRSSGVPIDWILDLDHRSVAAQISRATAAYLPFPDGASLRRGSLLAVLGNGVPVITTDGMLCPQDLRPCVRFADTADDALCEIDAIANRPELAQVLGSRGQGYAERFAWPTIAAAHLDLYLASLSSAPPTPATGNSAARMGPLRHHPCGREPHSAPLHNLPAGREETGDPALTVLLITQEDPFYIPQFFRSFCRIISNYPGMVVIKEVVVQPSFSENKLQLAKRLFHFYGWLGFLRLFARYVAQKAPLPLEKVNLFNEPRSIAGICRQHNIAVRVETNINSPAFIQRVLDAGIDLIVSISAPQIFEEALLEAPCYGCINIHNGRLPDYRGMLPNFWQMLNGEAETTTTIHSMVRKLDAGAILWEERTPIRPRMTLDALIRETKRKSAEALWRVLGDLLRNKEFTIVREIEGKGSYYSFPKSCHARQLRARGHALL